MLSSVFKYIIFLRQKCHLFTFVMSAFIEHAALNGITFCNHLVDVIVDMTLIWLIGCICKRYLTI